jgi:hypothetical protein
MSSDTGGNSGLSGWTTPVPIRMSLFTASSEILSIFHSPGKSRASTSQWIWLRNQVVRQRSAQIGKTDPSGLGPHLGKQNPVFEQKRSEIQIGDLPEKRSLSSIFGFLEPKLGRPMESTLCPRFPGWMNRLMACKRRVNTGPVSGAINNV